MKTNLIHLVLSLFFAAASAQAQKGKWTILFDGNSTDKFRGYNMSAFPSNAWKVEDGALATQTDVPNIDLVTKERYKNFELEFEWKVSKAGNSGVFFHMQETLIHQSGNGNSPNWLDNYEFQLLDDINFNDQQLFDLRALYMISLFQRTKN